MRNKQRECDVLVIGGGPGGLAAASSAKKAGAKSVIILERDARAGGILNQCIHDGFGLIRYGEALTGPEYAYKAIGEARGDGVEILTSCHVSKIRTDKVVTAYTKNGIEEYKPKSIVLATGCRERTRGNISIPGSRPAGVFTAGVAQNLVNCRNVMVGKRVVILGSGDIGLIMARRLTLEGAKVIAVAEVMPEPKGLARNVSQCVYEFDIPLYVKTTVSNILGKRKLEAVELSDVDDDMKVIPGTGRIVECDTLILSVGLIPENEVAESVGVKLLANNGVDTDRYLQTSIPGIFSCGNSRRVMDLADYVSEQGEVAGRNAVHYIMNQSMETWDEEKTNCMKKGFPEKDTITCTVCPNGCQVKWDSTMATFSGNRCNGGVDFARQERTNPRRTVTSTIRSSSKLHPLVSVRTTACVPKASVFDVMDRVRTLRCSEDLSIGDEVGRFNIGNEEVSIAVTEVVR